MDFETLCHVLVGLASQKQVGVTLTWSADGFNISVGDDFHFDGRAYTPTEAFFYAIHEWNSQVSQMKSETPTQS
jgi:hypothetical protein